jgi:hypothetical protein
MTSCYRLPFRRVSRAKPTAQRVQDAFQRLVDISEDNLAAGKGMRIGQRLYLYMAGHGFAPSERITALLTANATPRAPGYHIPGQPWADHFIVSGMFDEVILFMDCCQTLFSQASPNLPPFVRLRDNDASVQGKYFYGYGAKWSQDSSERVMEDGKVHGVFTTALIAGLKGAAAEPETGRITANSLTGYLYGNMKNFLAPEDREDPDVPKEPHIDYEPDLGDSFVIAQVAAPRVPHFPVRLHIPQESAGQAVQILKDGRLPAVARVEAAPQVWQVDLKRGFYLAQVMTDRFLQTNFEVSGCGGVDVHF